MVTDGMSFIRRAQCFVIELQAQRYPNANTLSQQVGCSYNTAQRTIDRLQHEFGVPCTYDASKRGFYLLDKNYALPAKLPPGKDELTALLLARELLSSFDADDITKHLDGLWNQYAAAHPAMSRDLGALREVFSSDATTVCEIADAQAIRFVTDAVIGQDLRITYESPWSGAGEKTFEGRILRVHFADGALYILFLDKKARKLTLNTGFIKTYQPLNYKVEIGNGNEQVSKLPGDENWLAGFGIWAGDDVVDVVVQIKAPASRYFASQRWHSSQEDIWDGENLVRKLKSALSPELVRRVISLGEHLAAVEPVQLRNLVLTQAEKVAAVLR